MELNPQITQEQFPASFKNLLEQGIPFGNYRLIRKIALGGMAEVYLALTSGQFGFSRQVVVKVLLPSLARHDKFVEMFIREAKITADFRHPALVQVYDLGRINDLYYISMEFVDGVDLMRMVRRCRQVATPIPLDLVLAAACQVADGLHAVHETRDEDGRPQNIVHLDVTPQNMMLGFDGQAKLVDFGVARNVLVEAEADHALIGKGPYMAPEQWAGDPPDRRTDLFALGIVLYELTVGRRLFRQETQDQIRQTILNCDIPRPSKVRPEYLPDLEEVVMRCLARDPNKRFPDARSFRQALEGVQIRRGGKPHPEQQAGWLQRLFTGVSRDDLWPRLDLNAPGQLTEAQQAIRRTLVNLPAFSQEEPEFEGNGISGPAALLPHEKKPPPRRGPSLPWIIGLLAFGALLGAVVTFLLYAL